MTAGRGEAPRSDPEPDARLRAFVLPDMAAILVHASDRTAARLRDELARRQHTLPAPLAAVWAAGRLEEQARSLTVLTLAVRLAAGEREDDLRLALALDGDAPRLAEARRLAPMVDSLPGITDPRG